MGENRAMVNSGSRLKALFSRKGGDEEGRGSLDDYDYNLRPRNSKVVIRLAESQNHQDELSGSVALGVADFGAMILRRSLEDERTDAPMPVRLFGGGRVSGVVGIIPRGLEAPVDEALGRLAEEIKPGRIPVTIVETKSGYRVDLLIGTTR